MLSLTKSCNWKNGLYNLDLYDRLIYSFTHEIVLFTYKISDRIMTKLELLAGPHGVMVTFNLTWIARKYDLEELLFDDNLSLPNSSLYADLSMRLVYSGVRLRNPPPTTENRL